jgi:Inositol 1,3,4-trisphosphate 5/6-kinase ATP-grasp domain
MGIAFNETGLRKFQTPLLLQEYLNHDRSLFKVFTLGDWFDVVTRSSLPNLEADGLFVLLCAWWMGDLQ